MLEPFVPYLVFQQLSGLPSSSKKVVCIATLVVVRTWHSDGGVGEGGGDGEGGGGEGEGGNGEGGGGEGGGGGGG